MSSDFMRTNLVTHLHCAECGNQLNLSYPKDEQPRKKDLNHSKQKPPHETGAAIMVNRIMVHPCQYCIEKHTGPAKKLMAAIKEMQA